MIKCENGVVAFTGIDYERAESIGVPKEVAELTQMEVLVQDLAHIFGAMATKIGPQATVDLIELAVSASLDPQNIDYTEEDTE